MRMQMLRDNQESSGSFNVLVNNQSNNEEVEDLGDVQKRLKLDEAGNSNATASLANKETQEMRIGKYDTFEEEEEARIREKVDKLRIFSAREREEFRLMQQTQLKEETP